LRKASKDEKLVKKKACIKGHDEPTVGPMVKNRAKVRFRRFLATQGYVSWLG